MPRQDYHVIVSYCRRRQKEANEARLAEQYPNAVWWLTASGEHQLRIYNNDYQGDMSPIYPDHL